MITNTEILNNPLLYNSLDGKKFILHQPLDTLLTFSDGSTRLYSVPTGFVTDFASIPRITHPIIPKLGRYNRPAILHDYLYASGDFPRRTADTIFLLAMKNVGVSAARRQIMYLAVRVGGWVPWNKYRKMQ